MHICTDTRNNVRVFIDERRAVIDLIVDNEIEILLGAVLGHLLQGQFLGHRGRTASFFFFFLFPFVIPRTTCREDGGGGCFEACCAGQRRAGHTEDKRTAGGEEEKDVKRKGKKDLVEQQQPTGQRGSRAASQFRGGVRLDQLPVRNTEYGNRNTEYVSSSYVLWYCSGTYGVPMTKLLRHTRRLAIM